MNEYARYKRKNGSVFAWPTKLYIPVPLSVKNRFATCARLNKLSQAEFGAVVVMYFLDNQHLVADAIREYKLVQLAERQGYMERCRKEAADGEAVEADRRFGGVFKSSFSDGVDDAG